MNKKLVLLISLLLPLISVCGENPTTEPTNKPTSEKVFNYKESDYSNVLNKKFSIDTLDGYPRCDVQIGNLVNGKNQVLFQYNENYDDYYTCAYISDKDAKFISEDAKLNQPFGYNNLNVSPLFAGINLQHINYSSYRYANTDQHEFSELKWYEIPLEETIPLQIDNYSLILISKGYYFDYYDLDKKFLYSKPIFIEQPLHELYNTTNKNNLSSMKNRYEYINNIINKKKNYILNLDTFLLKDRQNGYTLYQYLYWAAQEVEKIDDVEYISLLYTTYGTYDYPTIDLKEKYDYIQKDDYFYFKLSDIISFIEEVN